MPQRVNCIETIIETAIETIWGRARLTRRAILAHHYFSARSKNRVPEESIGTPGPNDDAIRRLERRLEAFELAAQNENRWWRGGLIAALVLVALSIMIARHHRHCPLPPRITMGQMGEGWQGPRMMPYGPPPNWDYGPGPQGGYGDYGPPWGWHHRHHDDGPGPEGEPPPPPKG